MSHEVPTAPKIYFIDEVAEAIRRSPAATRWLIQTGRLQSTKLAGRRVVTQEQLDAFFGSAV